MPRELRLVHWITALLVVLALVMDVVNGRFWMSDFRVYWSAADALIHGTPVYGVPFGQDTGFYKYAPMVAIAFVPAALLPFPIAAAIHFLFIGVALMRCQFALERVLMRHVFGTYAPRLLLRGILGLMFIAVLLARELHLGNINVWLMLGAVLGTEALLEEGPGRAGLLLGALWFVKPYLLLMAVPLVAFGQWRVLWYAALVMLAGLFAPIAILGHPATHALTHDWFASMFAHGSYLQSPDTIGSLFSRWSQGRWNIPASVIIGIVGLFLYLVSILIKRSAIGQRPPALTLLLWSSLALIPNLVITDQEHFLFTFPLISYVLARLFLRPSPFPLGLFIVAAFLYALRSSDLWGNAMEASWTAHGALGVGNLLLMCTAVVVTMSQVRASSLSGR